MDNKNKPLEDTVREEVFDQSVDELRQLESEQERKPNNEKIKAYIEEVKAYLDRILSELDEESTPNPNAQRMGSQVLKASDLEIKPSDAVHVDSQGFASKQNPEPEQLDPQGSALRQASAEHTKIDPQGYTIEPESEPEGSMYVDSQGFIHSTAGESRANEPENWRKASSD